jgi:hypothetical protein
MRAIQGAGSGRGFPSSALPSGPQFLASARKIRYLAVRNRAPSKMYVVEFKIDIDFKGKDTGKKAGLKNVG